MLKAPFGLYASVTAGLSTSSIVKIGDVQNSKPLGAAKIHPYVNAYTGELFIQDTQRRVDMSGFSLALGYVINAGVPRFNQLKTLKLTGTLRSETSKLTVTNGDGAKIEFTYDSFHDTYINQHVPGGQQTITLLSDGYQLTHYKTGEVETYNAEGQLTQRRDSNGNTLSYTYSDDKLTRITSSNGAVIHFDYSTANTLKVSYELKGEVTPLATYGFNAEGRLIKTQIPQPEGTPYEVNYQYASDGITLTGVSQSDTTALRFGYEASKISTLTTGTGHAYSVSYGEYGLSATITAPDTTTISLDLDGSSIDYTNITSVTKSSDSSKTETTRYGYEGNALQTKLLNNGAQEWYTWSVGGLLDDYLNGVGAEQSFNIDYDTGLVTSKSYYNSESEAETTWQVFDENRNLRFSINNAGVVTAFDYDAHGNRTAVRVANGATLDVSEFTSETVVPLKTLTTWWAKQDLTQTTLTSYGYDERGQLVQRIRYDQVDAKGEGVPTPGMAQVNYSRNLAGRWVTKTMRISATETATTTRTFDGLGRVTSRTAPYDTKTTWTYDDAKAKVTKTAANRLTTTTVHDAAGLIREQSSTDGTTTRTKTVTPDKDGRPVFVTGPGGKVSLHIYDGQGRLTYEVDPLGYVIEHYHGPNPSVRQTCEYANYINVSKLTNYRLADIADAITRSPEKDRVTTRLYDGALQLRYVIDADNGVVEYRYNPRGQRTTTVAYATPLPVSVPKVITPTGSLAVLKSDDDRESHRYYSDTGVLLGKQDADGYVTEYLRDNAGRLMQSTQYYKATAIAETLDKARPKADLEKDSYTYYYRDAAGRVIGEVDAERYLTVYSYFGFDKVMEKKRYATQVKGKLPRTLSALIPKSDAEDKLWTYQYDQFGRETLMDLEPDGVQRVTQYDKMGNILYQATVDKADATKTRAVRKGFNAWSDCTSSLGARACLRQGINGAKTPSHIDWSDGDVHNFNGTALVLSSVNAAGHKTVFYYNDKRQLVYSINAKGAVVYHEYSGFNDEKVGSVQIAQLLNADLLSTLEGGFITTTLNATLQTLRNAKADLTDTWTYTNTGNVETHRNVYDFLESFKYNAFQEESFQTKEIYAGSTTTTALEYNKRGLKTTRIEDYSAPEPVDELVPESQATASTPGLNLKTSTDYGFLGKAISTTDAKQLTSTIQRDRLGRKLGETDPTHNSESQTLDAFDRVTSHTDKRLNTTKVDYDTKARTKTTTTALDIVTVDTHNGFGETVETTNALKQTATKGYDAGGAKTSNTSFTGAKETAHFTVMGQKDRHIGTMSIETQFHYGLGDSVEQVDVVASTSTTYTTKTKRDAFERETKETDPRNVVTTTTYAGIETTHITDPITETNPKGLNIVQSSFINGFGKAYHRALGSKTEPNEFVTYETFDAAGRPIGSVDDPKSSTNPNGLSLTTKRSLDPNGNVLSITTPAGNIRRFIYDPLNRPVFEIDADGYVVQKDYDAMGNLVGQCSFATPLSASQHSALSDKTSVTDMQALAKAIGNPALDQWFIQTFNADNQLQYHANDCGQVTETLYDPLGQVAGKRRYVKAVAPNKLTVPMSSKALQALMTSDKSDRKSYTIKDADGRLRFEITPLGHVVEHKYLDNDEECERIQYAGAIDPDKLTTPNTLTPENVTSLLTPSETDDLHQYWLYEDIGDCAYHIDGEGYVTAYTYDAVGDQLSATVYEKPIVLPKPLTLSTLKTALTDVPKKRSSSTTYDAARRVSTKTDGRLYIESFQYNVKDDCVIHVDKNKATWQAVFDKAGRLTDEIAPECNTVSTKVEAGVWHMLRAAVKPQAHYVLDADGHSTATTTGYGTVDARTVDIKYNKRGKPISKTVEGVPVDTDVSAPASETNPDVTKLTTVTSHTRYDAWLNVVAEQDEAGFWRYHVYNTLNQKVYDVDAEGVVTAHRYNVFGEEVQTTVYATPIKVASDEIVTPALIASRLKPDASQDRTIIKSVNAEGNVTDVIRSGVLMATEPDTKTGRMGVQEASPHTHFEFDAFGNERLKENLIDPKTGHYQQVYSWYDKNHNLAAESKPKDGLNSYVVTYTRDCDGHVLQEYKYATEVANTALAKATRATLSGLLIVDMEHDIDLPRTYDADGMLASEAVVDETVAMVSEDDSDTGTLPIKVMTVIRSYERDGRGDIVTTTEPNGAMVRSLFNAAGHLIGKISSKRENAVFDHTSPSTTALYAIYVLECNVFGERTVIHKVMNSKPEFPACLPFKSTSTDQVTLRLYDVRGDVIQARKPGGVDVFLTQTAIKGQKARRYSWIKQYVSRGTMDDYLRQWRFEYDGNGQQVMRYQRLNSGKDEITQTDYNSFRERIGEGDGTKTLFWWKRDNAGKVYLSNETRGITRAKVRNGIGYIIGTVDSATQDLSGLTSAGIPGLLLQSYHERRLITDFRDDDGVITKQLGPGFTQLNLAAGIPFYAALHVGDDYPQFGHWSVSWPSFIEEFYIPSFKVWRVDQTEKDAVPLATLQSGGTTGADIGGLVTGYYHYKIEYYYNPPKGTQGYQTDINPHFVAQGQVSLYTGNLAGATTTCIFRIPIRPTQFLITGKYEGITGIVVTETFTKQSFTLTPAGQHITPVPGYEGVLVDMHWDPVYNGNYIVQTFTGPVSAPVVNPTQYGPFDVSIYALGLAQSANAKQPMHAVTIDLPSITSAYFWRMGKDGWTQTPPFLNSKIDGLYPIPLLNSGISLMATPTMASNFGSGVKKQQTNTGPVPSTGQEKAVFFDNIAIGSIFQSWYDVYLLGVNYSLNLDGVNLRICTVGASTQRTSGDTHAPVVATYDAGSAFDYSKFLIVSPIPPNAAWAGFNYAVQNYTDDKIDWVDISSTTSIHHGAHTSFLILPVKDFAPGQYKFRTTFADINHHPISIESYGPTAPGNPTLLEGTFTTIPGANYQQPPLPPSYYREVLPERTQERDFKGNITKVTHVAGPVLESGEAPVAHSYIQKYSKRGHLIERSSDSVTSYEDGKQIIGPITQRWGYGLNNHRAFNQAGDGTLTLYLRNTSSDLTKTLLPTGRFRDYQVDGFGRRIFMFLSGTKQPALVNIWDMRNNLLTTIDGSGVTTERHVNNEDRVVMRVDNSKGTNQQVWLMAYTAKGDEALIFFPNYSSTPSASNYMAMTYNRYRMLLSRDNGARLMGTSGMQFFPELWSYDDCGNENTYSDLAGTLTTTERDWLKLPTTIDIKPGPTPGYWINFSGEKVSRQAEHIQIDRNEAGLQAAVYETVTGITTHYLHDWSMRALFEQFMCSTGHVPQRVWVVFDADGRLTNFKDVTMSGELGYTRTGLRSQHNVAYTPYSNPGQLHRDLDVERSRASYYRRMSLQHETGEREYFVLARPEPVKVDTMAHRTHSGERPTLLHESTYQALAFLKTDYRSFLRAILPSLKHLHIRQRLVPAMEAAFMQEAIPTPKLFKTLRKDLDMFYQRYNDVWQALHRRYPEAPKGSDTQVLAHWLVQRGDRDTVKALLQTQAIFTLNDERYRAYLERTDLAMYYVRQLSDAMPMNLALASVYLIAKEQSVRVLCQDKETLTELFSLEFDNDKPKWTVYASEHHGQWQFYHAKAHRPDITERAYTQARTGKPITQTYYDQGSSTHQADGQVLIYNGQLNSAGQVILPKPGQYPYTSTMPNVPVELNQAVQYTYDNAATGLRNTQMFYRVSAAVGSGSSSVTLITQTLKYQANGLLIAINDQQGAQYSSSFGYDGHDMTVSDTCFQSPVTWTSQWWGQAGWYTLTSNRASQTFSGTVITASYTQHVEFKYTLLLNTTWVREDLPEHDSQQYNSHFIGSTGVPTQQTMNTHQWVKSSALGSSEQFYIDDAITNVYTAVGSSLVLVSSTITRTVYNSDKKLIKPPPPGSTTPGQTIATLNPNGTPQTVSGTTFQITAANTTIGYQASISNHEGRRVKVAFRLGGLYGQVTAYSLFVYRPGTTKMIAQYGTLGTTAGGTPYTLPTPEAIVGMGDDLVTAEMVQSAPTTLYAHAGETFASISLRAFGTKTMAHKIAEFNGLSSNLPLGYNMLIRIPDLNAPFTDYEGDSDPTLEWQIVGGESPYLPPIQFPPPKHHTPWWKDVVEAVIGVVVMLLAPELTGLLSLLEDVALGAAEGILDSEISYGELRLKVVLGTLISSVVGDEFKGFSNISADILPGSKKLVSLMMARGFLTGIQEDVVTETLETITGVIPNPSWKDLVESAVEGAVNGAVGHYIPGKQYLPRLERETVDSTVDSLVSDGIEGERIQIMSIVAQTIGSAMGLSLVYSVKASLRQRAVHDSESKANPSNQKSKRQLAEELREQGESSAKPPEALEAYYERSTRDAFYDSEQLSAATKSKTASQHFFSAGSHSKTQHGSKSRTQRQVHNHYVSDSSSVWAKREASRLESLASTVSHGAEDAWMDYDDVDALFDGLEDGLANTAATVVPKLETKSSNPEDDFYISKNGQIIHGVSTLAVSEADTGSVIGMFKGLIKSEIQAFKSFNQLGPQSQSINMLLSWAQNSLSSHNVIHLQRDLRYTNGSQLMGGIGSNVVALAYGGDWAVGSDVRFFGGIAEGEEFRAGTDIVRETARAQSAKGIEYLRTQISEKEWEAYLANPKNGARFLGQAVHNGTANELRSIYKGRFVYSRIGPDFIDNETGEIIELTTPKAVKAHLKRDPAVNIVTYELPTPGI